MLDKTVFHNDNSIRGKIMIISFFGHRSFFESHKFKNETIEILKDVSKGEYIEFYLGCYGSFDDFAYNCAKEYKEKYGNCKLIFITPYLGQNSRCTNFAKKCDESIYPEIEKVPLRFSIIERNKWVVNKSDFIIFYYCWGGGTAIAYEYATAKAKKFINIYR